MKKMRIQRSVLARRPTRACAAVTVALAFTVLGAACGPNGLRWRVGSATERRVQPLPVAAAPPVVPAPAEPAAPAAAQAPPPLPTEIGPGAPDGALVVPALVRTNLPPRPTWEAAEAARVPFPARIERWRPLVRLVLSEEWQQGTLDGPAQRIDDDLILAMIQQESQGNPRALSPVGAQGLMQVMPRTFAIMMAGNAALAPAIDPDAFWDESTNIRAGIRYLALAMQNHDGNVYWSLASYNAGIGTVKRWRLAGLYAVPPIGVYRETASYAQIIMRSYLAHRPGLDLRIPDPMPAEHVPGALELIRAFRNR